MPQPTPQELADMMSQQEPQMSSAAALPPAPPAPSFPVPPVTQGEPTYPGPPPAPEGPGVLSRMGDSILEMQGLKKAAPADPNAPSWSDRLQNYALNIQGLPSAPPKANPPVAGNVPYEGAPGPQGQPPAAEGAGGEGDKPKAIPAPIAKAYGVAVAAGASPQNALAAAFAANKKSNDESFDKETATLERSGMAEAGAEIQKQQAYEQQAQDLVAEREANAEAEADYQQAHAQQVSAIKQAQAEAMSQKVDPNHFFATRSAGQSVAITVGAALSGALQGLQGGHSNAFMDAINHTIDTDLQAQKANIDQKWQGVRAHQDVLGAMEKAGVDRRNADVVKRGLMLDSVKAQVEQYAAGSKSAQVQANAAQMVGQIERAKAGNDLQAAVAVIPRPTGVAAGAANYGAKTAEEHGDLYVPAAGGNAKDKETATKLNSLAEATTNIEQIAARLDGIRDKQGFGGRLADKAAGAVGYETQSHAELAQGKQELALQLKNLYQLGAISASDAAMLDDLVGDPHAVWTDATKKKLQGIIQSARAMRTNAFKAAGIKKVEQGYAADTKTGELHPETRFTGTNTSAAPAAMPTSFKPAGS